MMCCMRSLQFHLLQTLFPGYCALSMLLFPPLLKSHLLICATCGLGDIGCLQIVSRVLAIDASKWREVTHIGYLDSTVNASAQHLLRKEEQLIG